MKKFDTIAEKFVIPVASCKFVGGAKRALVMDLQRGRFQPVPLHLKELTDHYAGKQLKTMYADFDETQHAILDEYLDFLLKEEYILLSDHEEDVERFSCLPEETSWFGVIGNAIIDISEDNNFEVSAVITELLSLGCEQIQVRAYRTMEITEIAALTQITAGTICRNIEFVVPFIPAYETVCWETFLADHLRIGSITCYGAPDNNTRWFLMEQVPVINAGSMVYDEKHCGINGLHYFASNLPLYLESKQHNSCLHRKISIDKSGYIKNCPSMREHYGHISHTRLHAVLENKAFRKYWNISKDMIHTCRDCEYRYVCTDCRAYLETPDDMQSKPLKCGYDPYTATWNDWATNALKQEAILFYDIQIPCSP